jgi:hypothetical protein
MCSKASAELRKISKMNIKREMGREGERTALTALSYPHYLVGRAARKGSVISENY